MLFLYFYTNIFVYPPTNYETDTQKKLDSKLQGYSKVGCFLPTPRQKHHPVPMPVNIIDSWTILRDSMTRRRNSALTVHVSNITRHAILSITFPQAPIVYSMLCVIIVVASAENGRVLCGCAAAFFSTQQIQLINKHKNCCC